MASEHPTHCNAKDMNHCCGILQTMQDDQIIISSHLLFSSRLTQQSVNAELLRVGTVPEITPIAEPAPREVQTLVHEIPYEAT